MGWPSRAGSQVILDIILVFRVTVRSELPLSLVAVLPFD
jgi:hypothetical protein